MVTWRVFILAGTLAAVFTACGTSSSPTAPTPVAGLTPEVESAMARSIQDEFKAETIYQGVVDDLGPYLPFVNVLTAEQRHSDALARLFVRRGVSAPESHWNAGNVPHFGSVADACRAGVLAERENIAMYDELLQLVMPDDVRQVFENNRRASLVNHLPAFEQCS